ncbi:hypothetical protein CQW23_07414 [Capsicum baccatum]|uniref:Uncharacterized protein n=1 Tax=Capsicum baccatum TaxID=33114 RepID=A0A2G2X626_CAPBA|nr:hypothetical protein CQW23_07414 [Capsicum baccatum]
MIRQPGSSGGLLTYEVKLPSNLFGLIDLTYIKDKYSGFSIEDLLNVLSYLRSHKGRSHRHSDTKILRVNFSYIEIRLHSVSWKFVVPFKTYSICTNNADLGAGGRNSSSNVIGRTLQVGLSSIDREIEPTICNLKPEL